MNSQFNNQLNHNYSTIRSAREEANKLDDSNGVKKLVLKMLAELEQAQQRIIAVRNNA